MKPVVWKFGSIVIAVLVLHCGITPSSKLHPLLIFEKQHSSNTVQVLVKTSTTDQYPLYRIIDDRCTLAVSYHRIIEEKDSVVVTKTTVTNDESALQAGKFYGIWTAPDSLFSKNDTIHVYGYVTDETKHKACTSLKVKKNTFH